MRRIIDLTHPIHEGMLTYPVPWHPKVEVTQLGRHGVENRETRRIVMGTHTGTHMDAPLHFVRGGGSIDQVPLELLIGPARLLDFSRVKPKQEIGVADFKRRLGAEKPLRLVLRFDWSVHWGTMKFYEENPFISEEAATWLADRGVRLLAMDTPQVDSPEHGRTSAKDSPVHKIMLGRGVYFVEYLTNLHRIRKKQFCLIVLPLKLLGADGSPVRSVAVVE